MGAPGPSCRLGAAQRRQDGLCRRAREHYHCASSEKAYAKLEMSRIASAQQQLSTLQARARAGVLDGSKERAQRDFQRQAMWIAVRVAMVPDNEALIARLRAGAVDQPREQQEKQAPVPDPMDRFRRPSSLVIAIVHDGAVLAAGALGDGVGGGGPRLPTLGRETNRLRGVA